ncbi:MAG: hypothetical protein M3N29_07125 [Chloroflexota bacterium]|nr:hypothetical protein [Chloroflexota bacterium]
MAERTSTDIVRYAPWPFPNGVFPAALGAVVQRTVLAGSMPALLVVHMTDGSWAVGDHVNDPNEPGACVVAHIWDAIERNSSIAALADLPPGHAGRRLRPGDPWIVETAVEDD